MVSPYRWTCQFSANISSNPDVLCRCERCWRQDSRCKKLGLTFSARCHGDSVQFLILFVKVIIAIPFKGWWCFARCIYTLFSRWVNLLKYCLFSPRNLGKMNPFWLYNILQTGWNHQLVLCFFKVVKVSCPYFFLKNPIAPYVNLTGLDKTAWWLVVTTSSTSHSFHRNSGYLPNNDFLSIFIEIGS